MRRTFKIAGLAIVLLGPCHPAPLHSQSAAPEPRFPKSWAVVGGDIGPVWGAHVNGTAVAGGRAALAARFAHRFAIEANGIAAANTYIGGRALNTTCNPPTTLPQPGQSSSCPVASDLGSITGASLALDYLRGSYGTSSMLISAGVGVYHVGGQTTPSSTSSGIDVHLEQTLVQSSYAAVTVRAGAIALPHARSGTFWYVPIGAGVRIW